MSLEEAQEYADIITEELVARGYITQTAYGMMPANLSQELAELIVEKSEE